MRLTALLQPASASIAPAPKLAAAVARVPEHSQLERQLADLQKQHDALSAQFAAADAASPGVTPQMRLLETKLAATEGEIRKNRHALISLRVAHGRRTAAALRQSCSREAGLAIDALADLEAAINRLNRLWREIRAAGGAAPDCISPMLISAMRAPLRRALEQGQTNG